MPDEHLTISAIIEEASQKTRGGSDFWDWPPDRRLQELDVARILVNYHAANDPRYNGNFAFPEKDPPDVLLLTKDGRRLGIEVSEIVDEKTAAYNRHAKKTQLDTRHRLWTLDDLILKIKTQIQKKNNLFTGVRSEYDEIFLALMTDEWYIDITLAQNLIINYRFFSENIDYIYFILSYSPSADRLLYPDGYPIFRIEKMP